MGWGGAVGWVGGGVRVEEGWEDAMEEVETLR